MMALIMCLSICSAQNLDPNDLLQGHGSFETHDSLDSLSKNWHIISKQ